MSHPGGGRWRPSALHGSTWRATCAGWGGRHAAGSGHHVPFAGAQLRYELSARNRLSPYLSATAQFSHYGTTVAVPRGGSTTGQPLAMPDNLGQLGAGLGLRYSVSDSLALFGEGRVMYTTSPVGTAGTGWTTVGVNDQTRVDAMIGLTYLIGGHGGHRRP